MNQGIEDILTAAPVIPVVTLGAADNAPALARALVRGGLPVVEVTLRTPTALAAIEAIAKEVEDVIVGAGTVLNRGQLAAAASAGAAFAVSPGTTPALLEVFQDAPVPVLPGAATASEVMRLLEAGFSAQKFFPAEAAGGVAMLKSLSAPLAEVRFCPTGGITLSSAADYLALPNVVCVGGSWVVPPQAVADGAWDTIERLALETVQQLSTHG